MRIGGTDKFDGSKAKPILGLVISRDFSGKISGDAIVEISKAARQAPCQEFKCLTIISALFQYA